MVQAITPYLTIDKKRNHELRLEQVMLHSAGTRAAHEFSFSGIQITQESLDTGIFLATMCPRSKDKGQPFRLINEKSRYFFTY